MKKSFLFFQIVVFLIGVTIPEQVSARGIKKRALQALRKEPEKKREYPLKYLKKAAQLFLKRKGKNIVEIGSMRTSLMHPINIIGCGHCLDGHSTLIWANTLANVYTVDIAPENTEITKKMCKNFKNVHAFTEDGIAFLKKFDKPIDLLFLDAWDVTKDSLDYAEKHLEAYLAAKHRLHPKSLILIDDTDINDGGKGMFVIPQALKDGYKVIFCGRQTLLVRK